MKASGFQRKASDLKTLHPMVAYKFVLTYSIGTRLLVKPARSDLSQRRLGASLGWLGDNERMTWMESMIRKSQYAVSSFFNYLPRNRSPLPLSVLRAFISLRGRRLKGMGKGVLGARQMRGGALIPFPFPFERLPRRLSFHWLLTVATPS